MAWSRSRLLLRCLYGTEVRLQGAEQPQEAGEASLWGAEAWDWTVTAIDTVLEDVFGTREMCVSRLRGGAVDREKG